MGYRTYAVNRATTSGLPPGEKFDVYYDPDSPVLKARQAAHRIAVAKGYASTAMYSDIETTSQYTVSVYARGRFGGPKLVAVSEHTPTGDPAQDERMLAEAKDLLASQRRAFHAVRQDRGRFLAQAPTLPDGQRFKIKIHEGKPSARRSNAYIVILVAGNPRHPRRILFMPSEQALTRRLQDEFKSLVAEVWEHHHAHDVAERHNF